MFAVLAENKLDVHCGKTSLKEQLVMVSKMKLFFLCDIFCDALRST